MSQNYIPNVISLGYWPDYIPPYGNVISVSRLLFDFICGLFSDIHYWN